MAEGVGLGFAGICFLGFRDQHLGGRNCGGCGLWELGFGAYFSRP